MSVRMSVKLLKIRKEDFLRDMKSCIEKKHEIDVRYKDLKAYFDCNSDVSELEEFITHCEYLEKYQNQVDLKERQENNREELRKLENEFIVRDISDYNSVIEEFSKIHDLMKVNLEMPGSLKLSRNNKICSKLRENGYSGAWQEKIIYKDEYDMFKRNTKELVENSDNGEAIARIIIGEEMDNINHFNLVDPKLGNYIETYKKRFIAPKKNVMVKK